MGNIAEDILLLAIRRNGTIAARSKLHYALAGAQLASLAEARRIDVDHTGRIILLDTTPTGDKYTDKALKALELAATLSSSGAPIASWWVARQSHGLVPLYLEQLELVGTIKGRKLLGLIPSKRWAVLDTARVIDAKAGLDAITSTTGPVTAEQAAFAGLIHAVGFGARLYPRRKGRTARKRLEAIARQDEFAEAVHTTPTAPNSTSDPSAAANSDLLAAQHAIWSVIRCSVDATHQAVAQHDDSGHGGGSHDGGHGGFHGGGHGGDFGGGHGGGH